MNGESIPRQSGTDLSSPGRAPKVDVLGVQVDPVTVPELHGTIDALIDAGSKARILHVNVSALNLAYEQRWLRDTLNQAELVFCDGAGAALGGRILGHRIPERITYADWMWQLACFAEERDHSFFFLGARRGVAEKAAAKLKARFPDLRILGTHHGYFDKTPGNPENEAVIEQINAVNPDILIVGFGMPLQERWLMENWDCIEAHVALTGGAVFDYVAGELRRAPRWMTNHGLEWLGRLIIEPRRLWKRYLIGNPLFVLRVLRRRMAQSRLGQFCETRSPLSPDPEKGSEK
ncbi:MAG: WecB/TagA/CpsF family glycosyltransferase [bacterium]